MQTPTSGSVKAGAIQSRIEFVKEHGGESAVQRVLARLSEEDRKECSHLLTAGWYPFELKERLGEAIAAELGMGDGVFLQMGEKSAAHNLATAHKVFVTNRDPHGLLKRAGQIYQAYYDSGRREYENAGPRRAILRTFESSTFSKHDCLSVIGWHRKAIEMCGGKNVHITETKCRARGAEICEYVCEWE